MRTLLLRGWRAATRPLTISQALSSASGAGAMFIAAWEMGPDDFTLFALYTLVGSILLGLGRAGLFSAALIRQSRDPEAQVPFRYALIAAALAGAAFTGMAIWLGTTDRVSLLLLGGSAPIPILYDWLRFRAMAVNRRWTVAVADAGRTALVAASVLLPLHSSSYLQAYVSLVLIVPALLIAVRVSRLSHWAPYRSYAHIARMQVADCALGQTLVVIPLLLLGNLAQTPLIGGVRLAQSLLGPLNLVFAAAATNLIADGATNSGFTAFSSLVRQGRVLGRALATLSTIVVCLSILVVGLSHIELRGVSNLSLLVGLVLVGASTIGSGWSGIHGVILRLLDRQTAVTIAGGLVVVPTAAGFVIGYLLGGTDMSLYVGFVTLTVASPAIFWNVVHRHYRRGGVDASRPALERSA